MSLLNLHHLFTLLLLFSCHNVAANTEIINFSPSRVSLADLPSDVFGNWSDSRLHPSDNERRWSLAPAALHTPLHQVCERTDDDLNAVASSPLPFRANCPHELWVFLDLDDGRWASHAAFTLRLSWAASVSSATSRWRRPGSPSLAHDIVACPHFISTSSWAPSPRPNAQLRPRHAAHDQTPADFDMSLYAPQDLLDGFAPQSTPPVSQTTTRARYARIRAVHAGVPVLTNASPQLDVPFVLVLEPLYMGVLPASLLPTVGVLVLVGLAAAWTVPWVTAYLAPFARQARADAIGESACVGPSMSSRSPTHTREFKDR
ncbi:hypothetical protein JVU11DRAFT_4654 [Chiua virens]|nr:hypothetical protein JVU11DRAFT_4654 [Chiua virens]